MVTSKRAGEVEFVMAAMADSRMVADWGWGRLLLESVMSGGVVVAVGVGVGVAAVGVWGLGGRRSSAKFNWVTKSGIMLVTFRCLRSICQISLLLIYTKFVSSEGRKDDIKIKKISQIPLWSW